MLATGHPAIPTGDLDFTPLLYMGILLLMIRRSRVPFRIWMFPIAMVAGGLVDSISDGLGHSTLTTTVVLISVALIVHPPRASAPPLRPPDV
jgi:hypothetical protein